MIDTSSKSLINFPVLQTERLDLIEIEQRHLSDLFELFGDDSVTEFYNVKTLSQPDEAQKYLDWFRSRYDDQSGIRWGIALKGQKNIIGTIGFNNYSKGHRANIGYDLQKVYWNKGYIKEAIGEVVKYGFEQLGINRIEAEVMPGNIYSEKALMRIGFKKEGLLRDWMLWNETHYDMIMYSLLRSENR
jgi:ribosomal-protein-alanine N-acetyltransferase